MLAIKKHTIRKKITLDEFMKLKKDEQGPFFQMRQDAKAINFGYIFGMTASTFATRTLEISWSEEQADKYIKENNLRALKDKIISRYPREEPLMWKMITCASDIRDRFFKTYPGLMKRIERERAFAMEHGYVRCWHGACRRTPELFFMEKSDTGHLKGDDNKLYGKLVGNLFNIAANTTIQNLEAVFVMKAIVDIQSWLIENNMKSYVQGSVHDSVDLVIYKPELNQTCKKLREICCVSVKEMPLDIDIIYADLAKGEYYKGGSSWYDTNK
jgi:DNA polymerase I-like protein with 3'-5' exonuclease and polymerase domains